MGIRPFDLRDLPILARYRKQGLYFDNASVLTRGELVVPFGALFSYFAPATGIYTCLRTDDNQQKETLLGQVKHNQDQQLARLSFIAPVSILDRGSLTELIEYIIQQIGKRGAFHLLAEVDEGTMLLERVPGGVVSCGQLSWS